ncbi:MAG: homocysteine S-methyltransferase family protein [Spirochaetes bacterium]|nr:homocysteine S-methyltransferase family protein [Spirochaetota bacterium]
MTDKKVISELLKNKILVLDGATGTELQKKGMPAGVCPEIWASENKEIQRAIYKSYSEVGSDIIYTCTFGANFYKLALYGRDDVENINSILAQAAKKAGGENTLVAGDIGPIGHFIEPFGEIRFEDAVKMFKRQARGLLDGGCDLFVIETQMDIQEARAALIAVKELTDAFTIVTMTYEPEGRTLNGTSPEAALITLQSLGADAVGCNCSSGPAEMLKIIERLKPISKVPLVAKPNAGMPRIESGKTIFPMGPEEFASFAESFASAGINLMGGCCGTTPQHIKLLAKELAQYKPEPYCDIHVAAPSATSVLQPLLPQAAAPQTQTEARGEVKVKTRKNCFFAKDIVALSSATEALIVNKKSGLQVIGERINPTGKKRLQSEMLEGKLSLVRKMAMEQEASGASMLDINAGMPGINEKNTVIKIIDMLAPWCKLPLVIDSASPEVVEAALRKYPGRALINSISGEKEKIEKLLPVAAKYGAMFVLLPLADNELPETAERRIEIIKEVYNEAEKLGFTKNDIIIDGLVMTVSSNQQAPLETLKTIKWAAENGFSSLAGLSNVSFGLPERKRINSAFLSMAAAYGMTHVIANPGEIELMWAKHASDLLTGKDVDALAYLKFASANPDPGIMPNSIQPMPHPAAKGAGASPDASADTAADADASAGANAATSPVFDCIVSGNRDDIITHVQKTLELNTAPKDILEKIMIPAIMHVGELYDKKKYFLPQLIASAETMKKGFTVLEPKLEDKNAGAKGKILFATVEGDIHDIGKNIVILMLRNYGFDVKDLGKSVPADEIIKNAKEFEPDIIALSALMTTTMVKMPEVIELAKKEGITASFMVGGAVVTKEWAESIGAAYSKDGVEAVKTASSLAGKCNL